MSENPFAGKFDVRNFSGVMREIKIFRMNQMRNFGRDGEVNTAKDYWASDAEVIKLGGKLRRVYNAQFQKGKKGDPVELWMLGLAAYVLICQESQRIDSVCKMSGPKLVKKAIEVSAPIIEESTPLLEVWQAAGRPEEQSHIWQMPYFFEKEFMPEGDDAD